MGKKDLDKLVKLASQIADENAYVYGKQIKKSHIEKDIFRPDSFIRLADTEDDSTNGNLIPAVENEDTDNQPQKVNPQPGSQLKAPVKTSPMSSLKGGISNALQGGAMFKNPIVANAASKPFNASEYGSSDEAAMGFYELLLEDLKFSSKEEKNQKGGSGEAKGSSEPNPFSAPSDSEGITPISGPSANRKRFIVRLASESETSSIPTNPPSLTSDSESGSTSSGELPTKSKASAGETITRVMNPPDPQVLRAYGISKPEKDDLPGQGFNKFWITNRARLEKTLFTIKYGVASVGQGGRGGEEIRSLFAIGIPTFSVDLQEYPQIAYEMSSVLQSLRIQILSAAFSARANNAKSAIQTGFKWWDAISRSIAGR